MTLDAQRAVAEACHELAHEHADGRWVALGGGGYAVVDVVPRSWTHLVAIAAGAPVRAGAATVPEEWRQEVYRRTRQVAPLRMTDGRDAAAGGTSTTPVTTRRTGWTRRCSRPGGRCSRSHGLLP